MSKVNWKDKCLISDTVRKSYCYRDVLSKLGLNVRGSNTVTLKKWINYYNINTEHFNPYKYNLKLLKDKITIPLQEIIEGKHPQYRTYHLKLRLLKEGIKENKCEECGLQDLWNKKEIKIQLDHIDGDSTNHHLKNLRMLCPNCHSQTLTFAGKNRK